MMTLPIQIHLVTVIPALLLGIFVFWREKGTALHRLLGRVWVALMLITSVSSFFITRNNQYSWIHLLSIVSIISISVSLWAIRQGKTDVHRGCMRGVFFGAIVAGVFAALIPGRIVQQFLFG